MKYLMLFLHSDYYSIVMSSGECGMAEKVFYEHPNKILISFLISGFIEGLIATYHNSNVSLNLNNSIWEGFPSNFVSK